MALQFEDTLDRLGNQGARAVIDTYALLVAGVIDESTFIATAADLLALNMSQGMAYGRTAYVEMAAVYLDEVPDYTGLAARIAKDEPRRDMLTKSLATVLEDKDGPDTTMRLERLGNSTAVDAVHTAYESELRQDKRVTGWQRGLNATACKLCRGWAGRGRVFPKEWRFNTHPGCLCQQIPVYEGQHVERRYARDPKHRAFIDSLSEDELEYYHWAKSVRDEYGRARRLGLPIDIDELPRPNPRWGPQIYPPANPKITLRGIDERAYTRRRR